MKTKTKQVTFYVVRLKNGDVHTLQIETFLQACEKRGDTAVGHNFQTRLKQIQYIHPTAVDWEMVDEYI